MSAYVLLEDGTRFDGEACGLTGPEAVAVGEVVFTTGMAGYQESVTDPSFAGQLLTFTYPHIGNYGVAEAHMESDRIWARGAIMRDARNAEDAPTAERGWLDWLEDCGVPAITGVDTRSLTVHLRDHGSQRGGIFPAGKSEDEARQRIAAEPPMTGRDLAREVTPKEAHTVGWGGSVKIHAIDTGIKSSIVRHLVERGAEVTLHPCSVSAQELLATDADLLFLANGPGDPAALGHIVATVRELVGKKPLWGICLGHQLLCQAVGLQTAKLPFGHRGGNHPVKDLTTGRIEITSQNHGFAVTAPDGRVQIATDEPLRWETDFGAAELTHVNLYDGTVEGLTLLDVPASTVQYHPEAGPGPNDSLYLFDRFLETARAAS
jgi:carbamoyl-phosphate synthase small subunit